MLDILALRGRQRPVMNGNLVRNIGSRLQEPLIPTLGLIPSIGEDQCRPTS